MEMIEQRIINGSISSGRWKAPEWVLELFSACGKQGMVISFSVIGQR